MENLKRDKILSIISNKSGIKEKVLCGSLKSHREVNLVRNLFVLICKEEKIPISQSSRIFIGSQKKYYTSTEKTRMKLLGGDEFLLNLYNSVQIELEDIEINLEK